MAITAVVNRPYPNRVQIRLGTLPGPLLHAIHGSFDPRRDVDIYNDGKKMSADSFTWDPKGNRYLVFLTEALDFDAVTQVVHHVPNPPFEVDGNEVDGNPDLFLLHAGQNPDILAGG